MDVQVTFHRPINLQLTGQYTYSNTSEINRINVEGQLNIPQIFLSTSLQLIFEGMSSFTPSRLHFEGTFPAPLLLRVEGDYNSGDSSLNLTSGKNFTKITSVGMGAAKSNETWQGRNGNVGEFQAHDYILHFFQVVKNPAC